MLQDTSFFVEVPAAHDNDVIFPYANTLGKSNEGRHPLSIPGHWKAVDGEDTAKAI
jgi:hypothetical protein